MLLTSLKHRRQSANMNLNVDHPLDRRTLFRLLPILAAALEAQSPAPAPPTQTPRPPQQPQVVTKEMLHHALALLGIELTDAQETMALAGVNRNYYSYAALRNIDVPLNTEPAFRFQPAAPNIAHAHFAPRKPDLVCI